MTTLYLLSAPLPSLLVMAFTSVVATILLLGL